ncbi:hypothetical protein D9611_006442 [Ephemerocybe angulata]|uniref:Uncharacterized protein n=2 Tax=Ephemerocybe angulata TaxID=980116 RepID=A0A8H5C6N9_9AGAR|nr:hypothetical protein D9611_006442 [Tulosesus angulatus]KAF6761636.1 hypothetical protein DFP72DRAFT_879206 [Tulosesus angulatus]
MHPNKILLRSSLGSRRAFSSLRSHPNPLLKSPAAASLPLLPSKPRLNSSVWARHRLSRASSSFPPTTDVDLVNDAAAASGTSTVTTASTSEPPIDPDSDAGPATFASQHLFRPAPTPLQYPHGHQTLLPLVLTCNNLVLPQDPWHVQEPLLVGSRTSSGGIAAQERVIPFLVSHDPGDKPIGWLLPEVAAAISRDHLRHFQRDSASPWEVRYFEDGVRVPAPSVMGLGGGTGVVHGGVGQYGAEYISSVSFADWVNEGGRHARTLHMERLILEWRRKKVFADLLKDWSDEPYPVFNHPKAHNSPEEPLAFAIESAALPIFGLPNYGALLTAYVYDPDTKATKLWIPRRSRTKKNAPGRLDVTAGGGIRLGDTPLATIIRESSEEALLDSDFASEYIRSTGTLPFPHRQASSPLSTSLSTYEYPESASRTTSSGNSVAHHHSNSYDHRLSIDSHRSHYILPGLYFLYELELPADGSVVPQPNILDGEVESFSLMGLQEVLNALLAGRFKSSSAMAVVDWLVRHGYVTEENDSRFAEVCRHLRVDVGMPGVWRKRL